MASPLSLSQVFYTVMRLSDLDAQPATIERHISVESFKRPRIALHVQFTDFCIESGFRQARVWSKNGPKSEPSFAIQSQFEMGRQAAGCCLCKSDWPADHPQKLTDFRHRRLPFTLSQLPFYRTFLALSYYVNLGLSFAHGRLSFRNNVRDISQSQNLDQSESTGTSLKL